MTTPNSLVTLAHKIVQNHLRNGAIAIDATIGNGHDTLFLAQLVGPFGFVYGFDIQKKALEATQNHLQNINYLDNFRLILESHAKLLNHVDLEHREQVSAIMFNLGYLPGSDKTVITHIGSTIAGLNSALQLLAPDGIITILAYPGHQNGDQEMQAVQDWCSGLNKTDYKTTIHLSEIEGYSAPQLFLIEKILP
jgi:SAM-dependent methyltransferase